LSQSKSEDNWLQEAWKESTAVQLTREETREIKMLKRRGYKDFADAYCEYFQLKKQEGSLDYTLKEFCEKRVLNTGFQNSEPHKLIRPSLVLFNVH
jgi:hypothetical protein